MEEDIAAIVSELIYSGVKLVAFDFDETLISIHTHGHWTEGAKPLVEHIRQPLLRLIELLIAEKFFVAIVTFSLQPFLIKEVLRLALPKIDTEKIIVQSNATNSLTDHRDLFNRLGKEKHITAVLTELYNRHHAIVHKEEVLLLDDQAENINTAVEFGHSAFLVTPDLDMKALLRFTKTEVRLISKR